MKPMPGSCTSPRDGRARTSLSASARPLLLVLGEELMHLRDQLVGNRHQRVIRPRQRGLVFRRCLLVGLVLLVLQDLTDPLLVPSGGKPVLSLHLRRLLRRNAASALPLRSYAVTTKALRQPESGTKTTWR